MAILGNFNLINLLNPRVIGQELSTKIIKLINTRISQNQSEKISLLNLKKARNKIPP